MATILIDVGDGTLIVPPPAAPPPTLAPAPPPPALAPAPPPAVAPAAPAVGDATIASSPIILPGQAYIDLGDVLGVPVLIPAPPVTTPGAGGSSGDAGSGEAVPPTDDEGDAAAEANANTPDLSGLPELELLDPFGIQLFAVTNPPLKGGGALTAIAQACVDYGVDPIAAIADALHEGANGGIGDGGSAYGPFQDHLTTFADRPFYGKGLNNSTVNAWAWSDNGIRYSVRQMATATPSAKGLHGHAAVYAIVYGYERPADKKGAYATRSAEYDKLIRLGSGWPSYAAPLFKGPASGGAVDDKPIVTGSEEPYKPAGALEQWRGLVDVFKTTVPRQHGKVKSLADSLVEVFR